MIPQTSSSQQQPVFNMHSLVSREKKTNKQNNNNNFLEREKIF